MKSLICFAASLLAAVSMAVSCSFGNLDLDGSDWEVYKVDDRFNGSTVNSFDVTGSISISGPESSQVWTMKIPSIGVYGYEQERDELIKIVRSSARELVVDFDYYEYDDVNKEDCEFVQKFKGVNIYKAFWGEDFAYVYFKPNGKAVDASGSLRGSQDERVDSYRIYCRRKE